MVELARLPDGDISPHPRKPRSPRNQGASDPDSANGKPPGDRFRLNNGTLRPFSFSPQNLNPSGKPGGIRLLPASYAVRYPS